MLKETEAICTAINTKEIVDENVLGRMFHALFVANYRVLTAWIDQERERGGVWSAVWKEYQTVFDRWKGKKYADFLDSE